MPDTPNRVLLVEDDSGLTDLLGEGLRRRGLQVATVGSGRECVEWLGGNPADLLVIDYSLPDMTGAALVEELRAAGAARPFIVTTGRGDEEVAVRLMKLGALDYLVKDARLLERLPIVVLKVLKEVATARRLEAAELALQESERRYRHLLASITDYLYTVKIVDGQPVATSHGPGCVVVTGYTPEEYGADPHLWLRMVHPEDRAEVEEHARVATNGMVLAPIENRILHKDGSVRWVQNTMVPRRDWEGRLVACDGIVADITDRKHAELALRESEERFRQVSLASSDVVYSCVHDEDGRFILDWIAGAVERITGYTAAALKERRCWRPLVVEEDRARFDEKVIGLKGGESGACELRLCPPDGSMIWVASDVRCMADPERPGRLCLYGALTDITERKKAEAALARDEAELAAVYDHTPIMMLLMENSRTIRRLNQAAWKFLGRTPTEPGHLRAGDLLGCLNALDDPAGCGFGPQCDRCALRRAASDALQRGITTERVEIRPRLVRGQEVVDVTMLASAAPVNVAGEVLALLCLEDVSRQKIAEHQVREQAALLDVTRDAIMVVDLDGAVNYWNRGAEQIYGWPAGEAVGRTLAELVGGVADGPGTGAALDTVRRVGEWSGELRQRTRGGDEIVVLCRGVRMHDLHDPEGEARSILFTASDITAAKRIETHFLRAQRLESLGSLASGVAHDLNNVFTPIVMSIDMMRGWARDAHDREMIQLLGDSARRGTDIVRQLLLFGRGSDSPRTDVAVTHVIRELQHLMQETFPKNLSLSVRKPADLWTVHGDHTQLHQVLLNLCVNSRDAMPQGGRLVLTAENIHVDEDFARDQLNAKPGPHVLLRVADSGTGIPREHIEKIFDPFFTTKPVGQGTGLGLATVLGIVRSHGGFVTVRSAPGAGSEFSVYLPARVTAAEGVLEESVRQTLRGRGERVLVVDDEASIRRLLHRALRANGYEVIIAADGREAMNLLAGGQLEIQLVITDVMMPHLDGLQLVTQLRARQPRLPVLAISGLRGHRAEFDKLPPPRIRHLAKPFSTDALFAAMREAIDDSSPS